MLGLELAAKAPSDGYSIACGQGGNLVIVAHTCKKLPYDPLKEFAPVALLATNYLALVVHPSAPFKSVKDLVAYAKANPGKLTFDCSRYRSKLNNRVTGDRPTISGPSGPGLDKRFKPHGTGTGYAPGSLILPGHLVPTALFNEFGSLVAIRSLEFLDLHFVVRAVHELGDADRRPARQDRLVAHLLGHAGGRPATPHEADPYCEPCP